MLTIISTWESLLKIIAEKYGITREEQDAFALESQKKAVAAVDAGRFKDEIVPVVIPNKKEILHLIQMNIQIEKQMLKN